jgi:hypothetical protein
MQDLTPLIFELLDEEYDPDNMLISLYLPLDEEILRPDIYTKVKSELLDAMRSDKKAKQFEDLHLDITEQVQKTLDTVDEFYKGLAVFIRANATSATEMISIKAAPLAFEPEKQIFIGDVYDLDQLIWIDNYSPKALVTVLTKNGAQIYKYDNANIHLLEEKRNPYLISEPNEYREKFSPTPDDKVLHGTGGKNTQRQKDKVARKFVEMMIEEITDKTSEDEDYKHCFIFHSVNFDEYKKMIKEKLSTQSNMTPILEQKAIQSRNHLTTVTQKAINRFRTKTVKDTIELAEANPGLYAKGWYEVTEASRQEKVRTLFITPKTEKSGYILENLDKRYVYTYPVKDSHKVKNIAPWIVRNVLKRGGEIMTIPKPDVLDSEIAALLRY